MKLRQQRRFAGCRIGLRVRIGLGLRLGIGRRLGLRLGIGGRHRAGSAKHPEVQRLVLDIAGYAAVLSAIAAPIGSLALSRRNENAKHTIGRIAIIPNDIGIQVALLVDRPDRLHVLADHNGLRRGGQRQVILTSGDVIPALCGGDVPAVLRIRAAHGERVALNGARKRERRLLLRVDRRGKRIGDFAARHRDGDGIRRLDVL